MFQFIALAPILHFQTAQAAVSKNFTVTQAHRLALINCENIKKTFNQIIMKRMKYTESVRGMQEKARNKQSLRWSPILTFKLPEKLDFVEDFDLAVKPLALMAEITTLEHKMNDQRFALIDTVNKVFFDVYILQEKVRFHEEILELAELELQRNKARFATGEARQNDIETMETTVERIIGDLARLKRNFQTKKEELSKLIKLDVTTGYRFAPPLQMADISREQLEGIITFTLANDHTFYTLRVAESIAMINLNESERLFRGKYGSKMNAIMPFISSARQGNSVDVTSFRQAYDKMLIEFDSPWAPSIKILFLTFSMEFLKGEVSGTRYIEDEIYALITACQEYVAARRDREKAEEALRNQIVKEFEPLVSAKNSALSLLKAQVKTLRDLERLIALNKIGKAEYEEVKDKLGDYQEIQLEAIDAMKDYNELLSNFDRLTCGAITRLMKGQGLDTDAGEGGLSLPGDGAENVYYYIYNDVADLTFVFGLDVPEDFEPEITHFEIWYEGNRIGRRTSVENRLRHLTLVYGDSDMLTVRVFNGDEFVDECDIDTTIPRDILPIKKPVPDNAGMVERIAGTYTVSTTVTGTVSTSQLTLLFNPAAGAGFYQIVYGDNYVYSSELVPATDSFSYLTLLIAGLSEVRLIVYDKDRTQIFEARFDTNDQTIKQQITD
jgi:hypothetical protein